MRTSAVALMLLAAPWCAGEWIRVASPGMEVLTDAGEKTGRGLLARLERIRELSVKRNLLGGGVWSGYPWPVRVFAFASENEFNSYRDSPATQGFYSSGSERDYIGLYADPSAARVAFHEYVHLILNHSAIKLPTWFEEGTAEFYSTLAIEAARVRIGLPIESHAGLLSRVRWLTAPELAAVNHESPFYTERDRVGIFYAESWALVHMLNLSPAWRDGMTRFVQLLGEEQPQEEAFCQAFGRPMDRALADLPDYLRQMKISVVNMPVEAPPDPRVEPVSRVDATIERADLALNLHRPQLARSLLEKLPESPESVAGLGGVALAEGHKDEARQQFARAVALGSRDAAMFFEFAMLERDAGETPGGVRDLLKTAISFNPEFADANYLLGVEETDEDSPASAVEHLRQAVRMRPRRSDYWHALAYAQFKLGRREDALQSAQRALATAEGDMQTESAEAIVSMTRDQAPAAPKLIKQPGVFTPPSWENRKGDTRVEGTLTRVDCNGSLATLYIESGGKSVTVQVHHPDQVVLVNAEPGYQFSCGPQQLRVAIEYVAAQREVTRIEFRH